MQNHKNLIHSVSLKYLKSRQYNKRFLGKFKKTFQEKQKNIFSLKIKIIWNKIINMKTKNIYGYNHHNHYFLKHN